MYVHVRSLLSDTKYILKFLCVLPFVIMVYGNYFYRRMLRETNRVIKSLLLIKKEITMIIPVHHTTEWNASILNLDTTRLGYLLVLIFSKNPNVVSSKC